MYIIEEHSTVEITSLILLTHNDFELSNAENFHTLLACLFD